MWPDEYIDWALWAKPEVARVLGELLLRLARTSLVRQAVPEMVQDASRRAFATLDAWRRYGGLIADRTQFRQTILALGAAEALRVFLNHEYVAARVQQLEPGRRRAVLLRYAASLCPGDMAAPLGIAAEDVTPAVVEGLDLLRDLL